MKPIPIQTPASINIHFTMPIPVETSDEGCVLKVTFPNDIPLTAASLMFQGGGVMTTPTGGADLARNVQVYARNQEYSLGNYLLFRGCTRRPLPNES